MKQLFEFANYLKSENLLPDDFKTRKVIASFRVSQLKLNVIALVVSRAHNIFLQDLGKIKSGYVIAQARQVAMWVMWHYTESDDELIGCYFGKNGHQFSAKTVEYSRRMVNQHYETEPAFRRSLDAIVSEIELKFKRVRK